MSDDSLDDDSQILYESQDEVEEAVRSLPKTLK